MLLQFITVAAFVLDAFAFVAEKEVGEAFGAGDPVRLRRAVRLTSELALGSGVAFSALYLVGGEAVISTVVSDPAARASALAFLPFCAAVPMLGMPAWQLDGIFLGTTRGRALRTAGVAAALLTGFDLPEEILRPVIVPALLDGGRAAVYVGYTNGEPVTTGLGVRSGTTIGIYNIATIESARGRGYGAAMTRRVAADGAAAGCEVAILQSSDMGFPIYQRLGYRRVLEYSGYVEPSAET